MSDRIDGADAIHAAMIAVLDAEKSVAKAAGWFFPAGYGGGEKRERHQKAHDELKRIQGELRDMRIRLAAMAGELYGQVYP